MHPMMLLFAGGAAAAAPDAIDAVTVGHTVEQSTSALVSKHPTYDATVDLLALEYDDENVLQRPPNNRRHLDIKWPDADSFCDFLHRDGFYGDPDSVCKITASHFYGWGLAIAGIIGGSMGASGDTRGVSSVRAETKASDIL